ncbi:phosphoglycerol transferase family protein, alkaline phosphatase superfamily [Desulfosporosinus orientis DSM 765]|uniref:Phosphoglycerol transferase family protein, alkaline phosphatase superfamily n=1 Tax=Desulfosporosinus orientis (strain ATCC 19365 / DSM 765 / NCIMB 8382 / VKM B-1628 / Singapore I) TaxID=768706 RepID=G7WBZ1_DESOD|nr:LTA synthase family protein [Desulfosporosinus orientis]AET69965.1 phosphoglycerol transferase family protein, alkaline phosphatase superfamily [Desulfosporosinus orientis DSM 765]
MLLQRISQNTPNFKLDNRLLNICLVMGLPLSMLFALDATYRGNIFDTLHWIRQYPKQFALSYVLMFGFINLFYILHRKIYTGIGVLFLSFFSIVGFISREKLILRGEPLLPWDLILSKEAMSISKAIDGNVQFMPLLLIGIITLILLGCIFLIPKENFRWRGKLAPSVLSLVILLSFYTGTISLEKSFSLQQINWSQKLNYDENGMLLGFILNTTYLAVEPPNNYQQDAIQQIIDQAKPSYTVDPNFKPNIIFVMSEAFWDPTLLKEVSFSEDPIPYFHYLQKTQTQGIMLSPVYGGGTANTEFEVLTGLSTQFLPRGVIPYVEYVRKPIEALPTALNQQGYETAAIHTYDNWFYGRNNVYKYFDFNKFISKEFFNNPEYNGQYIRDTELSKRILDEIQKTDKPDFIYAVSMQAHGPYSSEETEHRITTSGNLTKDSKAILENYTETISDVDQSLKLLIQGLEQINQPSIVVFFGDHLPMLGTNYDVYKEAHYFQDEITYEDYLNMHSVPFVVWDNFSDKKDKLRLSSNFLGSYVLKRAEKAGTLTTDFLSTLSAKGSSVIINNHHMEKEKISETDITDYQLLQYDLLFGDEYAYQFRPDHKPPINSDYVYGDGPPLIVSAASPHTGVIELEGENFTEEDQVYVNGQVVQSTFENPTRISISLPEGMKKSSEDLEIKLKLADSMGHVISESNIFKMASFSP